MTLLPKFVLLASLTVCGCCCGQTKLQDDATFAKYPVSVKFHGPIAKPDLTNPDAHQFRTRIKYATAHGPVFADHYAVAIWGCGTGCIYFAFIDCKTGAVFMAPFTVSGFALLNQGISYHRNSRALHVIGELNEKDPADRWYVWDGKTLELVSEQPAKVDPEMQP